MGALKIDCYCNETQMEKIIDMVTNHLNNSGRGEIDDFDNMVDDIRICVEFDTYMDVVGLKASEILDTDWDLLYEDSAVLTSRLKSVLGDYNARSKEIVYQAHHIIKDRWN